MTGAGERPTVLAPPPRATLRALRAPPTFSIVIPAYQAAATIKDAVRSALAQTHQPREVIVVDDGSTDEPERALGELAKRVRLIRKANEGSASARNEGARVATGEFLAILDADDEYHPRRLEVLAALARQRPDLDFVTTDAQFFVEGAPAGRFYQYNRFAVTDQRTAILESCFPGGWPAVRLARLRAIGGFDETLRVAHDWDCWLRLILDGSQAGLVDEPYYKYRLHPASLTANRVAALWERVTLLEKAARNPALREPERRVLARCLRARRNLAVMAEVDQHLRAVTPAASGGPNTHAALPRARLTRLAAAGGIGARTRAAAGLAAVAPALARRIVPTDLPPGHRSTDSG
ncbi:MAG: glycosyltransferase family 2 protein [Solirubrobacteraceae bacterium]